MTATLWRIRHCALALLLMGIAAGQEVPDDKSTFEGVVRNSITKLPVAKASIHLIPTRPTAGYAGAANAQGAFRFESIGPGTYRMLIEKSGYADATAVLNFKAGQKVDGFEMALTPFGAIAGTVVGPDGEPMEGARLTLVAEKWQHGKRVYQAVDHAETADDGTYRFDVAAGRYYIHAGRPAEMGPLTGTFREAPDKPETGLAGGYFPDTANWDGRAPVEVFGGTTASRIDFGLRLAPVFHVRGKREPDKLHDGSEPINIFLVARINDQAGNWDGPVSSQVRPDGSFDIGGVTPGSYFLNGLRRGYEEYPTLQESAHLPVMVASQDLNAVRAEAVRWFNLSGRIQGAAAGTRVGLEGVADPLDSWHYQASPKADGTFSIANLTTNRYTVRVAGDAWLKSIRYNGEELRGIEIDLTGGAAGDLELVLSDGAGRVEGTVEGSVRGTGQEVHAVLIPEKVPLGDTRPLSADVDQSGHFAFANVPPGSYRAFAVADYDAGLWENAEFLAQVANRGKPVEVPEKNTVHLDVNLLSSDDVRQVEARIK